jgi:hypothetical protein
MSLKHTMLSLGGLSAATATIAADGPIGIWLVCGLIALCFSLIATLALVGTFAEDKRREAAQAVLTILLGRERSPGVGSARQKSARGSAQPTVPHGPQPGAAA